MSTDKLLPNGDDGGWPTGSYLNIDEGIASADGSVLSTNVDDDTVVIDLTSTVVADSDVVTALDIVVRVNYTGGGTNSLGVELLVGGSVIGIQQTSSITTSFQNLTFSDVNWDADWTQAQLNGAQVRLQAIQSGKPTAYTVQVDALDVDIVYSAGGVTNNRSATDGLFLTDTDTSSLIRGLVGADGMFLDDARFSEVLKTVTDYLFVSDSVVEQTYGETRQRRMSALTHLMFGKVGGVGPSPGMTQGQRQAAIWIYSGILAAGGGVVNAVSQTDGVFLSDVDFRDRILVALDNVLLDDRRLSAVEHVLEDTVFLDDSSAVGALRTLAAADQLFLSDSAAAFVVRGINAIDNLFLLETAEKTLAKTILDAVLLSDSVVAAKGKFITATDGIFLSDDAALVADKVILALDDLLLDDSAIRQTLKTVDADNLLLSDLETVAKGKFIAVVDGLFLSDDVTKSVILLLLDQLYAQDYVDRDLQKIILASLLLSDSSAVARQKAVTAIDGLLLSDSTIETFVRDLLAVDGVLLDSLDSRTREAVIADAVFLSDTVSSSRVLSIIVAADTLLLKEPNPALVQTLDRLIADAVLMLDFDTRIRELTLFEQFFLSDSVSTTTTLGVAGLPLTYAALRSVDYMGMIPATVDYMASWARFERNFMGVTASGLSLGTG